MRIPPSTDESMAEDVDWAVYRHAKSDVTVNLNTMMGEGGDAMGDTLVGIELVWGSDNDEEGEGDTFIAGPGADLIHGDLGSDTVSYEASSMGVMVTLSDSHKDTDWDGMPADAVITTRTAANGVGLPDEDLGPAVLRVSMVNDDGSLVTTDVTPEDNINGAAGDRLGGIENLTGSAHDDVLVGNADANTFMGMGGDDRLTGNDGDDDSLHGGDGDDIIKRHHAGEEYPDGWRRR